MIEDPLFYLAAVPAVLIVGIAKGGFAGGLGIVALPLMALTIAPRQAAAIMLPILCVMDLIGLWAYRWRWDPVNLRILFTAALVGIALGTASFRYLDSNMIRLLIGAIAVIFTANYWLRRADPERPPRRPSLLRGGLWGTVSGFTSFVAHAGGPPASVYLLPQRLDKTVYQATTVIFFTAVNYVKLVPYAWLGQLGSGNLTTSLILMPLAVAGVSLGIWLHSRISAGLFYRACYLFLFGAGVKLLYDGCAGLL